MCADMDASSDFEVVGGAGCIGSQWHCCDFSYIREAGEAGDPLLLLLFCSKARAPAGREAVSVRQACLSSRLYVPERLLSTHMLDNLPHGWSPVGLEAPLLLVACKYQELCKQLHKHVCAFHAYQN